MLTEYPVPRKVRQRLQRCYEHATRLMRQESYDFDYAHTLLLECVVNDPSNILYLESFFQNLYRKYNGNKRGALFRFGGKGEFKKALARQQWAEALKRGPVVLKKNPWDVPTLRGLAQACEAYGYNEAELRYLKKALEMAPQDAEVNRHCARSLARMGQFDQAITRWTRVDELCRGDAEAQKRVSELQLEKTRAQREGKPKRGVLRQRHDGEDEPRPARAAPSADGARREIPLTPRQQLEQAIVNDPAELDHYFRLTDLHVEHGRLGEAVHVLHKALSACGRDLRAQERLEDVEILRKKQQLAIAERQAASQQTAETQELVEQLRSDVHRYELEVFQHRSQRYPQDLEVKFQLGLRLKRVGNLTEAIRTFEFSVQLPERQPGSTFEIGECLQRRKQFGRAVQYYSRAADQAKRSAQKELRKLALYRAGVLAAGLANDQLAEQLFSKLVAIDNGYKDAASRLDKIHKMRHKQ